jgi:DNA-binding transcriptional regulator YiaG
MAKPLSHLLKKTSQKVKAHATIKAAQMLTEMSLMELRKSRNLTQVDMAERLNMKQPSIAQFEKREDLYISTLRNYLHALGGELEITARFPDGMTVAIRQFD